MLEQLKTLERQYAWQSLTVNGHEWRWLDTGGSGPAVILLPGSVGDGAMFVLTMLALEGKARVVAVTYPALAQPRALADGLVAVMDHLKLDRATIAGSSFAAYWAQFVALAYPERVKHLVIGNGFTDGGDLAANPLFDRDYVERVEPEVLHEQWLSRIRAAPSSPLQQLQAVMLAERQNPVNLHARFLGVVQSKPCPALPLPASAVTVLDCDDDPLIPPAARERLRNCYPDARHVSLASGGHYPHLLNPTEYQQLILSSV